MEDVKILIPARFNSSRFPGKPLVRIDGRCMINHVVSNAMEVVGIENVYVCADEKLAYHEDYDVPCRTIIVKEECLTGTDRVFHATKHIQDIYNYTTIVNLQGDEPYINPITIRSVIRSKQNTYQSVQILATTNVDSPENRNKCKLTVGKNNDLIYASRFPIKSGLENHLFLEQMGIFVFDFEFLELFCKSKVGPLESMENIEILRCIEKDMPVQVSICPDSHQAIDVPNDLIGFKNYEY